MGLIRQAEAGRRGPGRSASRKDVRRADARISVIAMSNTGYRSVEINVVNDTRANLTIMTSSTASGSTFIVGETPKPGQVLNQYQNAIWGVMTNEPNGSAIAQVSLTGLGAKPVLIGFQNLADGMGGVKVIPNQSVLGNVIQMPTGETNHTQWQVQLVPQPPMPPLSSATKAKPAGTAQPE